MSRVGLIYLVLFVADVASTAWAGTVGAQEANPFVRSLLDLGGYAAWIIVKGVLTLGCYAAYRALEPHRFAALSAAVHRRFRKAEGRKLGPAFVRAAQLVGAGVPAAVVALACVNNVVLAVALRG